MSKKRIPKSKDVGSLIVVKPEVKSKRYAAMSRARKAFLVFTAIILVMSVALLCCGCERPEDVDRAEAPPGGPLLMLVPLIIIGGIVGLGIWWWRRSRRDD